MHLFHGGEKQSACALCEGDSKAVALLGAAGSRDVTESPSLRQSACALCEGDSKAVALLRAAGSRDVTESPSLRQEYKCGIGHPRVAFLHLCSVPKPIRKLC